MRSRRIRCDHSAIRGVCAAIVLRTAVAPAKFLACCLATYRFPTGCDSVTETSDVIVLEAWSIEVNQSAGFRAGVSSVHTSRTIMLHELSLLFEHVAANADRSRYVDSVISDNALGKPTRSTRQRTAKYLVELFSLDRCSPVFRVLRELWAVDVSARPLLAYLAAAARDPLLREASPYVLSLALGTEVTPFEISAFLEARCPGRFRPSTLHSTSQNLASTWTQAGYLRGRVKKVRARVVATPVTATFALLLGYLCGLRGRVLLDSPWTRLLDRSSAETAELAVEASKQGWMTFKISGSVIDASFPNLLRAAEVKASSEPH